MNFDLLITLGIIAVAAIYLLRRHFKKDNPCCGCSGCSNTLEPKPRQDCCPKKD
ncbi:FeoB-associated Cys-rich membrane protein [Desulfomicrobium sp. ZS1]|jgi:hypothetical protein|uniref:FeoB-associated Cys-rich membrane protein n=1 Tax=Desulfomicrobium sp. ZS1 TaxID=2952228 RepID=UPI0020B20174|nr:FeoB-associated Cys-rich membrane protein [Desulfomicrobium sp. ZS1]UTF50315.1 FeoB-associated Cys-rich membrane protein [Desulfomicrobium sp. ZS1]